VRVISGTFGGRLLTSPRGETTRPTSDKVRQALFNILGDVEDDVVLDLYAGTGALGLEALSRGAARVTFVEQDRAALAALRQNVKALGVEARAEVLAEPVEAALARLGRLGRTFTLVLSDPPYDAARGAHAALLRVADAIVDPIGARLVLEADARDEDPAIGAGYALADRRRYGDTALVFVTRSPRQESA
jgi:16S rRNA (guanine966-N2)-methyltransferase